MLLAVIVNAVQRPNVSPRELAELDRAVCDEVQHRGRREGDHEFVERVRLSTQA
jgi:hypothetical protein